MGERSRLNPSVVDGVARYAPLAALTAINLLNYIDRYVISALLPSIQADVGLDDTAAGLLGTAFMVVYFVVSPLFGWLGDRYQRPPLLAAGVALWSLATAATGLCRGYGALFAARAAVGIGESAYGSVAPSFITDLFARLQHGRALSMFYLAIPVGSALGYLLGGVCGGAFGWRNTFFLVGLPGLLLSLLALRLRDPARGERGAATPARGPRFSLQGAMEQALAAWRGHVATVRERLRKNRVYVVTVAGLTAYTFGLGGFAFWAPSFMIRERGYSPEQGMLLFGGITVVTGSVGTLTGGWLGDWLRARTVKGYSLLNAVAVAVGGSAATLCLSCEREPVFLASLVVAQLSLFLVTGPVNALIVGCVPSAIRGTAMATSIFCIHLFGDAISPVLIGRLSDRTDLRRAMALTPAAFFLAAAVWGSTLLPGRRSRAE